MEFEYNCNNNTCNCAINKKYHLSEICLQTYPCRHTITYINERKETNTISSANIVRLFQKENLPIPKHYQELIEYVRKQDHPTPEEINEKYTNKEKELRERIINLEKRKEEKDKLDHIINTTKASSRIERLKNKHSISGAPIIEEPPKQRRDIYSYDFNNEIIRLKKEYENLLKQMNKT